MKKDIFCYLTVTIKPGSAREGIETGENGSVKVKVHKPPVGGEANNRLREIMAKRLGVSKSCIEIYRGEKSREKILKIIGIGEKELKDTLISYK